MTTEQQAHVLGATRLERVATLTLAVATIIVGASIVADGSLARGLNGVAGLTWFASATMFVIEARRRPSSKALWLAILGLTALVAFVIRPSDIVLASIGFLAAGCLAGVIARRDQMLWAKLIPALYLPLHIGTAILKAAGRNMLGMEAGIRTDPPPTAVVVPAVMLIAAVVGGVLAARVGDRQAEPGERSTRTTSSPRM